MIIRISLAPFDLGGSDHDVQRDALESLDFREEPLEELDARLLGLDVSFWTNSDCEREHDFSIYLERRGFGVLVDRETTRASLRDHKTVAELLIDRRALHQGVQKQAHPMAELIDALRSRVSAPFSAGARWSAWTGVPYVFTFYADEGNDSTAPQQDALQGALALCEPSRVGMGDTELRASRADGRTGAAHVNDVAGRIRGLGTDNLPPDIDGNDSVTCYATWASLVVIGRPGALRDAVRIYELLEVRTQIAWVVAHLVRRWCEKSHVQEETVSSADLDEVRRQTLPLLREVTQRSDASRSTRHERIFEGLKRTSGLLQEIGAAEDALQWSFDAAERSERSRRRRYERMVEVLLGVLAVLQLTTLISDVPLVSLPRWASLSVLGACTAGIAFFIWRRDR